MVTQSSTPAEKEVLNARLNSMSRKQLIELAMNDQDEVDTLQYRMGAAKFILRKHLLKDGGTMLPHPEIEVKAKYRKSEYDFAYVSSVLKENFSPEEMVDMGHTPEKTETVTTPEKYDMRILRGVAKYGKKFEEMLEKAVKKGDMIDISLKRKKGKSNTEQEEEEDE